MQVHAPARAWGLVSWCKTNFGLKKPQLRHWNDLHSTPLQSRRPYRNRFEQPPISFLFLSSLSLLLIIAVNFQLPSQLHHLHTMPTNSDGRRHSMSSFDAPRYQNSSRPIPPDVPVSASLYKLPKIFQSSECGALGGNEYPSYRGGDEDKNWQGPPQIGRHEAGNRARVQMRKGVERKKKEIQRERDELLKQEEIRREAWKAQLDNTRGQLVSQVLARRERETQQELERQQEEIRRRREWERQLRQRFRRENEKSGVQQYDKHHRQARRKVVLEYLRFRRTPGPQPDLSVCLEDLDTIVDILLWMVDEYKMKSKNDQFSKWEKERKDLLKEEIWDCAEELLSEIKILQPFSSHFNEDQLEWLSEAIEALNDAVSTCGLQNRVPIPTFNQLPPETVVVNKQGFNRGAPGWSSRNRGQGTRSAHTGPFA
ncbi:hypothetical protein T439DRAFT_55324 [Meredithblackwellia eburnea MCA 4105]